MNQTVLNWLVGNDTGISSKAIVYWMERNPGATTPPLVRLDHPRDPGDLGRCIRLLDIEPSYRARINEMAQISPEWARLTAYWAELEMLYRAEERLPFGQVLECSYRMHEIVYGEKSAQELRAFHAQIRAEKAQREASGEISEEDL